MTRCLPRETAKRAAPRLAVFAAAIAFGLGAFGTPGRAQEASPGALAAAKELVEVKGATSMFDPLIPGVIETAKNAFLRTNPGLSKDLNEVAAQLRTEYAAKRSEIGVEVARTYATSFTEKELRDTVAFYKTPLGKKLMEVEPRVMEQSMTRVQNWAEKFSDDMVARVRVEMRKKGHNL